MSFCSSLPSFKASRPLSLRFRACAADVPDFFSADWLESRRKRPFDEAVRHQLDALMFNDQPRPDYGIEVMYRDLIPSKDLPISCPSLTWFERFRRIFHHSSYRALLGHRERKILSSLNVDEVSQFQKVGGSWDGYWLTESVLHDGDSFSGGVAY
ncbi:hypothetical protein SASPL_153134 [Salvia splendens]|uniref:Uncharacterized protein n=1 Tax=Salvia splendens TaxID=180675 RepID=A0A8X8W507_SALSN|nr:hypothetical protein SASPL_153134 [Salvia splendens]